MPSDISGGFHQPIDFIGRQILASSTSSVLHSARWDNFPIYGVWSSSVLGV
jgi:hypothetical protein